MRLSCAAPTAALLSLLGLTRAAYDIGYKDDGDLYSFVTRPELRAPRFNVKITYPEEVTPGYWFVAPYIKIHADRFAESAIQPCQIGPAIYDGNGELVWSGACMFSNRNICDFRAYTANGSYFLSGIITTFLHDPGHAFIMDESMEVVRSYHLQPHVVPFNMHEFNVIDNGRRALHIIQKTELVDLTEIKATPENRGLAANMGIMEYDLLENKNVFEYWMHDGIPHAHGNTPPNGIKGPYPNGWDWIHLNAVDRNDEGDYLVTARYTDAIYKISGKDKKLIWTLGGKASTFILDGFNASGPHDARFREVKAGKEYISFLDNGGDEERKLSDKSTGYLLELDHSAKPPVAKVVRKWVRPDGGRSNKRGNFQFLDNGNVFGGWSENAYISEHTQDGRVLMEAKWASERMVTYRAYKFNFTSNPKEDPKVKGFTYGESREESLSIFYASWNGATRVHRWDFYDADTGTLIGEKVRTGFETSYTSRHLPDSVYVQAIAEDGTVLRRSATVTVEKPRDWATKQSKPVESESQAEEQPVHEEL